MPIIYTNVSNGKYSVCCMGQTVYVYADTGSELARFTLVHAAFSVLSPKGDIFAVKNGDGCVAVYSFESLSRIATLKFSDKSSQQERGMCFSADGGLLYNVEHADGGSCIAAYSMSDFSAEKKMHCDGEITHIECADGKLYVLGKNEDKFFAAEIADNGISDVRYVSEEDYTYYYNYKCAEVRGFSSAAVELYLPKLHHPEECKNSIFELWSKSEVKNG